MPKDKVQNGEIVPMSPASPAQSLDEGLAQALLDPAIPIERFQAILSIRRELMTEKRKEAYDRAFAGFWSEVQMIPKDTLMSGMGYSYAPLENYEPALKLLAKYGFRVNFPTYIREDDRQLVMRCELSHSGYTQVSEWPVMADPGPQRSNIKAMGSGQTYTRRYLLESSLNLIRRDSDDDGHAAEKSITDKQTKKPEKDPKDEFRKLAQAECKKGRDAHFAFFKTATAEQKLWLSEWKPDLVKLYPANGRAS